MLACPGRRADRAARGNCENGFADHVNALARPKNCWAADPSERDHLRRLIVVNVDRQNPDRSRPSTSWPSASLRLWADVPVIGWYVDAAVMLAHAAWLEHRERRLEDFRKVGLAN